MFLQTTPAIPTGNTAPSPFSLLILAVGGLALIQFGTDYDLRDYVPSIGLSGSGGGSTSGGSDGGEGVLGFLMSLNGVAVGGLTLLSALIVGGVIDAPAGLGVPFVVALELAALLVILGEYDAIRGNLALIGLVVLATVVLGLSALGEPVIGGVFQGPTGVLLVIGGLYLANKALDVWGKSKRTVVRVRGRVGGDD